jgi:predicted ATPase/class 3 adenylate cyclase
MECPRCGSENPDNKNFCGDCGASLRVRCQFCGEQAMAGAASCSRCGAALVPRSLVPRSDAADVPAPAENRLWPDLDAERRQLTVLICDLVGSTALSAQLDPEDFRAVIAAYNRCIAQVVTRFDGLIARYSGDGVLAYFGFPQAHEDDAEQAICAGLALVEAVADLQTQRGVALSVRIGVATGTVIAGDRIGEGAAQEQAIFGEPPHLAARLQAVAEPGMVVICANTQRLAAGHFKYHDLGAIPLKGLAAPVQVWQVLRRSRVESRFEARQSATFQRPIGRDKELDLLMQKWRQAQQGEGQVVVVTGEPGIGKSHVAMALQALVEAEPHTRLRYFCSPHHVNSVLYPVLVQLDRATGFARDGVPAERLAKLKTLFADALIDEESLFLLADLLSVPLDPGLPRADLSAQQRKEKPLAALLAQGFALAAKLPVLVIFEDVHWSDPTSLALLSLFVEQAAQAQMLFVITSRPEFSPPWSERPYITTLALGRLNRRDGSALAQRVAGRNLLPGPVTGEILARADGVPLFIEELTKGLLESGFLEPRQGRYVLTQPLPTNAIPTTLQGLFLTRLDRLGPAKEVAQTGAAIGREFSYELLSRVVTLPREQLDEAFAQLMKAELLSCRGEASQAVYTFTHALVRDAAYAGLLRDRRLPLHAAIAQALEQFWPVVVETQPETLARHLTEAHRFERAAIYWLKAGRLAEQRSAHVEAIAHLEQGIAAVAELSAGAERDRLELDLQLVLGPCMIATQGPAAKAAVATFSRARELCARLDDPPECLHVMFWLATAAVIRGELIRANETVIDLKEAARAQGDRPALLNARRGHGMILLFLGRLADAIEETEAALALFEESDEAERLAARAAGQDAGAAALALLSWALWLRGDVDAAVDRINAALARADAVEHPHTRAYVRYYAAVLHALRGENAIALTHADGCLALSEEHGFHQWQGLARAVRGICIASENARSDAFDVVTDAVGAYRNAGYHLGITSLLVLLCPVLLLRGQMVNASEVIEQGLAIAERNGEQVFLAELYRLKAQAMLADLDKEASLEAPTLLRRALSIAVEQGARSLALRVAADLATIFVDQGRRDEAINLLAPIHAAMREGSKTRDLRRAEALLGRPE